MLPTVFDELRQTVDLLKSANPEEFYDISVRMRKYTNVDPLNGPRLVEKYVFFVQGGQGLPCTLNPNVI